MIARFLLLVTSVSMLAGCLDVNLPVAPKSDAKQITIEKSESNALKAWWGFFNDDVLAQLVSSAIQMNGASFEGVSQYEPPQSALAVAVAREYLDFRYMQSRKKLLDLFILGRKDIYADLNKYREIEDARLKVISEEIKALEKRSRDLSVEADKHIARLTDLTKLLPEYIEQVLSEPQNMPAPDIMPLLAAPAVALADSAKMQSARIALAQGTADEEAYKESKNIFDNSTIGQFFGVSDDVYAGGNTVWSVSIGKAVTHLDFDVLRGTYESEALSRYKATASEYVMELEKRIVAYSHMYTQYVALDEQGEKLRAEYLSQSNAGAALRIKLQDDANKAHLAAMKAHYEMARILIDIYDALDVY